MRARDTAAVSLAALSGFTVAVTADRRADEQMELLRRRGARVVHAPTVRTLPLADELPLHVALDALLARAPDVMVLTTGVGARTLLDVAESTGRGDALLSLLHRTKVVVRGPKAAGVAAAAGVDVAWRAASERGEEVLAHLLPEARAGRRIAVQRDGGATPLLAAELRAEGADALDLPVYRWELPADLAPAHRLIQSVLAEQVDAVTFTSSPAFSNFLELAGTEERRRNLVDALSGPVTCVCVGPVCAETAAAAGAVPAVVPSRARLGAMVHALAVAYEGRSTRLGDLPSVVVQGATVAVGERLVHLSDRERALLDRLLDAGPAVVSKRELAVAVWGPGAADHVVEVTIARLRRRLGDGGNVLRTVPRRGYRLVAGTSSSSIGVSAMTAASSGIGAGRGRPIQA